MVAILHRDPLSVHHLIKQYCVPTWSNLQSVAAILKSVERPGLVTASSNLATHRCHARSTAGSLKRGWEAQRLAACRTTSRGFWNLAARVDRVVCSVRWWSPNLGRVCRLQHANEPSTSRQGRFQRWSILPWSSPHLIRRFMLIEETHCSQAIYTSRQLGQQDLILKVDPPQIPHNDLRTGSPNLQRQTRHGSARLHLTAPRVCFDQIAFAATNDLLT